MKKTSCILTVFCIILMASTVLAGQKCKEDPCRSMTPALVGGPVAHSSDLLTMRYLAAANFELTYRNQVILLSTFYEHPEIVNLPDVKRADYIFMGHEDVDHDEQVAPVVKQTGALLYGNQNVMNHALADGVPAEKTRLLKSGDVVQFDGFTVEAVMMCHSGSNAPEGPYGPNCYQRPALQYYGQAAEGINLGGTCFATCDTTPRFGTCREILAYLFTFGKDFRLLFYDSAATLVSDDIKALMERIGGSVDVGTVAHAGGHSITQVPYTMVPIKVMNPRLFIPNHHLGMNYQMVAEDLFQAIRDEMPNTETLSLLYKEPLCFNVKSHIATKVSPLGSVWSTNLKKK